MLKKSLILLLLALLPLAAQRRDVDYYWTPHVDFDGDFGGWTDNEGFTLFLPFGQLGYNLFFAQGTIGRFEETWTGTLGGGYRFEVSGDLGWGINAFFDYAYSDKTNLNWYGGGIGGEVIGRCFEFRANAYVPRIGRRLAKKRTSFDIVPVVVNDIPTLDITEFTRTTEEQARWGFDVEGGAGIPLGSGSLWGYLGFFRFQGHRLDTYQGPLARFEYKLQMPLEWGNAEMWAGGEYRHDHIHGNAWTFTLHAQVPLYCTPRYGSHPNLCVFKRMGDSVRRNNGYILEVIRSLNVTEREVGLWFIQINANGSGLQTDPTSLSNANANSRPGDFIFVLNLLPGFQPIPIGTELGTAYSLKASQTLVSFDDASSVTLDLGGGATYTVTDLTGAGRGGLIQDNAALNAVELNSNNTVAGTQIQEGVIGILGSGKSNVTIEETIIEDFTGTGIRLENMSGTVELANNTIDGDAAAGTNGIALDNTGAITTTFNVIGNTIRKIASDALTLSMSGTGGSITSIIASNSIDDTGSTGNAALLLETTATAANAELAVRLNDNKIQTTDKAAIFGNFLSAAGQPVTINGAIIAGNNISVATGGGILLEPTFTNAGDTLTFQIDNTTFQTITGQSIGASNLGIGTQNLTITSNDDQTASAVDTTVVTVSNAMAGGTTCLTMTGNKTSRGAGPPDNITLFKLGGTFEVTDLADLSTNNSGMTVDNGGAANTANDCPLPVVP